MDKVRLTQRGRATKRTHFTGEISLLTHLNSFDIICEIWRQSINVPELSRSFAEDKSQKPYLQVI